MGCSDWWCRKPGLEGLWDPRACCSWKQGAASRAGSGRRQERDKLGKQREQNGTRSLVMQGYVLEVGSWKAQI